MISKDRFRNSARIQLGSNCQRMLLIFSQVPEPSLYDLLEDFDPRRLSLIPSANLNMGYIYFNSAAVGCSKFSAKPLLLI